MDISKLHDEIDTAFEALSYPTAVGAWLEIRKILINTATPSSAQANCAPNCQSTPQYEAKQAQAA